MINRIIRVLELLNLLYKLRKRAKLRGLGTHVRSSFFWVFLTKQKTLNFSLIWNVTAGERLFQKEEWFTQKIFMTSLLSGYWAVGTV